MNLLDTAAIRRVQSIGLRVVNPSDPPDLTEARKALEQAGFRVVPRRRRIPEIGSLWEPARGRRKGYMRKVFAANSETVVCRDDLDRSSEDIVLKLGSFWDWKLRTGARRVTV